MKESFDAAQARNRDKYAFLIGKRVSDFPDMSIRPTCTIQADGTKQHHICTADYRTDRVNVVVTAAGTIVGILSCG
jgi:hypothetical protein